METASKATMLLSKRPTLTPNPTKTPPPLPPPWEVIQLLPQRLDPKTLALASCVSKSWYAVFSSDRKPICHSLFPSSHRFTAANPSLSPRHLFLLLHAASTRRRRLAPAALRLSLRHLVFTVDVFHGDAPVLSLSRSGEELASLNEVFRFDVRVGGEDYRGRRGRVVGGELRVVWMVVTEECREAFAFMDCVGKGRSVGSNELWFSEKLPCPSSCCCSAPVHEADLEAEVFMELCDEGGGGGGEEGDGGRRVVKLCLGLMNSKAWRYLRLEDGLLYLQSFLLPSYQSQLASK